VPQDQREALRTALSVQLIPRLTARELPAMKADRTATQLLRQMLQALIRAHYLDHILDGWNSAHWSTSSEYVDGSISDWQNAINNVSFLQVCLDFARSGTFNIAVLLSSCLLCSMSMVCVTGPALATVKQPYRIPPKMRPVQLV
jgi:hypothetical protein